MKTRILNLFVALALLSTLNSQLSTVFAQSPSLLNFQGRIVIGGISYNGTGQFEFALVDGTGTNTYWSNDGTSAGGLEPTNAIPLTLTNGLYSILLGDPTVTNMTQPVGVSIFTNCDVRLRVWFNDGTHGFEQMTPDERLASSAYAMFANTASNVSGTISLANLPAAVVTNNESGVTLNNLSVTASNQIAPLTVTPNVPTAAIGLVNADGQPTSVAVAGNYAYVVNTSSNTLQIFDVSEPASPVSVGSVATGESPTSVAVAGNYACVANGEADTLQIFDVSDPASPASVGSVATSEDPTSVAVAGRYAYLASSDGLQIFDIGDPSAPVSVGSADGNGGYCIAVAGHYAYVVNTLGQFQIFDVSNPSAPVSVRSVNTGDFLLSVAVAGRYAYVANDNNNAKLQIFDVSNPSSPVSVGSVSALRGPVSIAVAGRYAYMVSEFGTLQIFDVSNPSAPTSVGSVSTRGDPQSIAVAGRYAYLADNTGTLQIFDLGGAYIQQFEAGAAEVGTLQTRDTVTVGNNLNVSGGLTVSGSARISGGLSVNNGTITATNFNGNGGSLTNLNASQITFGTIPLAQLPATVATNIPTAGNYVSAYNASSEIAVGGGDFQDVTFNNLSQMAGWTYSSGIFTCSQTGLYLVQYTATAQVVGGAPQTISLTAEAGGLGIAGSQSATALTVDNEPVCMSRSFIASFTSGSTFELLCNGSTSSVELVVAGSGLNSTQPSVSLTIIRLQ